MQTKISHTPGPWSVHGCSIYQNDSWNAGNNEGGKRIGSTYSGSDEESADDMPTEEQAANAQLIAAAPDLLEACTNALKCLTMDSDSEEDYAPEIRQLRAAITKATKA